MNTAAVFACQEPWPLQSTLNSSAGASQQRASTLAAPKPGWVAKPLAGRLLVAGCTAFPYADERPTYGIN